MFVCNLGILNYVVDWNQHKENVVSVTSSSLMIMGACYTLSALAFHVIPLPCLDKNSLTTVLVSLLPPSFLTYCLLFRMRKISTADFESRVWHSERVRGLTAGADHDGDGNVTDEEKSRESAEWANSLMRGIWPIINPDMFVSRSQTLPLLTTF